MTYAYVVLAALFHAVWNAGVKKSDNSAFTILVINLIGAVVGLILLVSHDFYLPISALPYLVLTVLVRCVYFYLLSHVYKLDEFSRAYPISRALAPLTVLVLSICYATEQIHGWQIFGVITICLGLIAMVVENGLRQMSVKTLGLTFAVGLAGGTFAFLDGVGVRLAEQFHAFMGWLFLLNGVFFLLFQRLTKRRIAPTWQSFSLGVGGGLLAAASYGLILWGYAAGSVVVTAALKETSIVFSVVLGYLLFQEAKTMQRVLASMIIIAGIVFIKL